jgi:hypothetical protein
MIMLGAGSFMHFALAFVLLFILAVGIGQPMRIPPQSGLSTPAS